MFSPPRLQKVQRPWSTRQLTNIRSPLNRIRNQLVDWSTPYISFLYSLVPWNEGYHFAFTLNIVNLPAQPGLVVF